MNISVKEVSRTEYEGIVNPIESTLPIWLQSKFTKCYKDTKHLLAYKGQNLVGVWIVPIIQREETIIAKREFRYLPYSSPFIFTKGNLDRRETVFQLFKYLADCCHEISLPFDPYFCDFAPIQGLGGFVEMRHTHILKSPLDISKMSYRLRNHISSAKKQIKIGLTNNPESFKFELAIKGTPYEQSTRKELAINLLKNDQAILAIANIDQIACAGVVVAYDKTSAYMLHSWQEDITPRGTMSALIYEVSNWAFQKRQIPKYDFEGSVFQKIDYYYSGFDGNITPYGHVFWSKDKELLHSMIDNSINISGRLIGK